MSQKFQRDFYYNRKWLYGHYSDVQRMVNHYFAKEDHEAAWRYMLSNPAIGRQLYENFVLPQAEKWQRLLSNIIVAKHLVMGIIGRQRTGKDVFACRTLDDLSRVHKCRIVTLGTFAEYPFVKKGDYFFSLFDIPSGTRKEPVIVYCSELAKYFPARDFQKGDNKKLNSWLIDCGQNHVKFIGCCQLASLVDVSFWRSANFFGFKHVTSMNIETDRPLLDDLGKFLIPRSPFDAYGGINFDRISECLVASESFIYTFRLNPPKWWDESISEQFRDIPDPKLVQYCESLQRQGFSIKELMKLVRLRFNVRKPNEWFEANLSDSL